jgi:hypothetical protein
LKTSQVSFRMGEKTYFTMNWLRPGNKKAINIKF